MSASTSSAVVLIAKRSSSNSLVSDVPLSSLADWSDVRTAPEVSYRRSWLS